MSQAGELCRQWSWSVDAICKLLDAAVQCLTELTTSSFDGKFIEAQLQNQWLLTDANCISALDITHPYDYEHGVYSQRKNLLCVSLVYLLMKVEGCTCLAFGNMAEKLNNSPGVMRLQVQHFACKLSETYELSLRDRPVMTMEQRFIMCCTECLSEEDDMYNVLISEISCFLIFRVQMQPQIERLHQRMNDVERLRSKLGSCNTLHTLRDIEMRIVGLREIDDLMLRLCHNLSITYPKIRDLCRTAYCQEVVNVDIEAICNSVNRL